MSVQVDAGLLNVLHEPVLYPAEPLPEPTRSSGPEHFSPKALAAEVAAGLGRDGMCLVHLPAPLDVPDFVALGRTLGEPLSENDPAITSYVEDFVVLSIRDDLRSDDDRLTPFTPSALTLHTEGSRRPVDRQPRFILLMCIEPGSAGDASQTVLVPVPAILDQLDKETLDVLAATRETVVPNAPPFVRHEGRQILLSFRDLGKESYEVESKYEEEAVVAALQDLLRACYTARPTFGTRWRCGDLVVIDNRRWMHGRTGAQPHQGTARHLQRLRVLAS